MVKRVIDGDTIVGDVTVMLHDMKFTLFDQHYRLNGINAPEITGIEKPLGLQSKGFLISLIEGKEIMVVSNDKDKYGRFLADLYMEDGLHINAYMVEQGFAEWREY